MTNKHKQNKQTTMLTGTQRQGTTHTRQTRKTYPHCFPLTANDPNPLQTEDASLPVHGVFSQATPKWPSSHLHLHSPPRTRSDPNPLQCVAGSTSVHGDGVVGGTVDVGNASFGDMFSTRSFPPPPPPAACSLPACERGAGVLVDEPGCASASSEGTNVGESWSGWTQYAQDLLSLAQMHHGS